MSVRESEAVGEPTEAQNEEQNFEEPDPEPEPEVMEQVPEPEPQRPESAVATAIAAAVVNEIQNVEPEMERIETGVKVKEIERAIISNNFEPNDEVTTRQETGPNNIVTTDEDELDEVEAALKRG